MFIGYPTHKLGDTVWFFNKMNQLLHGMVQLITITIKKDESNIWYSIVDEFDNQYTVKETEVIDRSPVPVPKYRVGDKVSYEYLDQASKQVITDGIIAQVETVMYSPNDPNGFEIRYYFEDDLNFFSTEDEILSFAETKVKSLGSESEDIVSEYIAGGDQCSLTSLRS